MLTNRKTILLTAIWAVMLLVGCEETQNQAGQVTDPQGGARLVQQPVTSKKRFQDATSEAPSAVESAIELSKKYSVMAEQMDKLRQENQRLTNENQSLKERLGPCESQLKQTQKELAEANDLLIEMRVELNNWKTDVLGFRNEIRDADQAQLEALVKILKLLGGEVKTGSAESQSAPAKPQVGEPNQPQKQPGKTGAGQQADKTNADKKNG